jgi:cytochrome P450
MPTRLEQIHGIFQRPDIFSNSSIVPADPDPDYMWIPQLLDPPIHTKWRQLLAPFFGPAAIEELAPRIRRRSAEILDDVVQRGECEYVADVALRLPNTIFMEFLGLPVSEAKQFQEWEVRILHSDTPGQGDFVQAIHEVEQYLSDLIVQRRIRPHDDLVSHAIKFEIDDEPVSHEDLVSLLLLLFQAGLDTVQAQLTWSMYHLATHHDDRRRLVQDPGLMPIAIEELLRYYSIIPTGRKVKQDTELLGCHLRSGQMVLMVTGLANHDGAEFPTPDDVVIDRPINRHLAFGAGPHRCLGSHLARRELEIGLTDWHARIPDYGIVPGSKIIEHNGVIGLDSLPLQWHSAR